MNQSSDLVIDKSLQVTLSLFYCPDQKNNFFQVLLLCHRLPVGSIAFHTLTVEVKVSFRQDETKTSEQHKQKQIRRKRDSERKEKFKTFCRVCSNDFSSATEGPQPYIFPSSIQFSLVPGKGPCRKLFVFPSVFLLLLTMLLVLIGVWFGHDQILLCLLLL